MCLRYFQRGTFRPLPHKIGVGAMILFDTLCTMSVDANVLITFLSFFGKEPFFALSIPTSFNILMTYFTAVIVQFFLCHLYFIMYVDFDTTVFRCLRLSRTRKRVISLCLALLALVHVSP